MNRHNINESDVLVKPEWAWFLGFFWADGCFYLKANTWALELKSTDFDQIWPILNNLGFNSFCSRTRQGKYHQKSIKSSKLSSLFREFDFDKKSKISPLKLWSFFSKDQKIMFLRGLFEGDGCFTHNSKRPRITMNGSKDYNWDFLLNFFLENNINLPCVERKTRIQNGKERGYSILTWSSKKEVSKIAKLLYSQNTNISLERKFLLAKSMILD
jgi:intein/homing endonuclease